MAENPQATFTEVLELVADVGKFSESLAQLKAEYVKFMEGLGSEAGNVIGDASIVGLKTELKALTETLHIVFQDVFKGIQDSVANSEAAVEKLDTILEANSVKMRARAKADAEAIANTSVEAQEKAFERLEEQASSGILTKGQTRKGQDILTEQEGVEIAAAEKLAKFEESRAVAKRKILTEERDQAEALFREEQRSNSEKEKSLALLERQKKLAQDIEIEQEGLVNKYNAEQASIAKVNASKATGLEHLKNMALRIGEIYILWNLVNGAAALLKDIIAAPFEAIANGVKYLADLSEMEDRLTGVLHANLEFTNDFTANLQKSRDLSKEVVDALRQVSISSGLPLAGLEKTFSALVSSGAGSTVRSMQDLVTLTEDLELGLRGTGRSAEQIRGIVSQLPEFFNGSLKANSELLTILHLQPAEAQRLVASAKQHHDLVEQLAPRFKPYLDAVKLTALDHDRLVASLTEWKNKLEGIAAAPLLGSIDETLKNIRESLIASAPELEAMAKVLGDVINDFAKFFANVFGLDSSIKDIFRVIDAIAIGTSLIVKDLTTMVVFIKDIFTIGPFSAIDKAFKTFNASAAEADGQFKRLKDAYEGAAKARKESGLDEPPGTQRNPQNLTDNTGVAKADFQKQLADIKEFYDAQKEQVKQYEADLLISKKEAAASLGELNKQELEAATRESEKYISTVKGSNKDLQQQGAEIERAKTAIVNLQRQLDKEDSSAQRAASKEAIDVKRVDFQEQLALVKEHYDSVLKLQKELETQGYQSHVDTLSAQAAADRVAHEQRLAQLEEQKKSAAGPGFIGKDTKEYAEIVAKISEENARFRSSQELTAVVIIGAVEREDTAIRQFILNLQLAASSTRVAALEIIQALSPVKGVMDEAFSIQSADLNAKIAEIRLQLELARAKDAESASTRKLTLELKALNGERVKLLQAQLADIASNVQSPTAQRVLQRDAIAQARIQATIAGPDPGETIEEFRKRLENLDDIFDTVSPNMEKALDNIVDKLVGFDLADALDAAKGATAKFAVGLEAASNVLANLSQVVNVVKQGAKQGGALGGIGAGIGAFSGLLEDIPVVGQFLPAIGGILSFIGGLFTQAAKRIAEDIKKSFQNTIDNYNNGNATLVDTINSIDRQRTEAIIRLSGQKGGKDELDKLLPEMDKELQTLREKQQQIIGDFNTSLISLRLHSDTLAQVNKQWADINKAVKDYIGAGGDAAAAAEFLSLNLEKIKQQSLDELDKAEQDAIHDAEHLNDLLTQRNQIVEDYKKKQFDLINADALERRQIGSVDRAAQLAALKSQTDAQIASLDQEIALTQQKVDKEGQVFKLSTDISDLHRRDEELTLKALDQQIQKLKDLQTIANGITLGANGQFGAAPGFFLSPGAVTVQVTITNPDPSLNGKQVGTDIGSGINEELNRQMRYGPY
jgi:hypothetical protein